MKRDLAINFETATQQETVTDYKPEGRAGRGGGARKTKTGRKLPIIMTTKKKKEQGQKKDQNTQH